MPYEPFIEWFRCDCGAEPTRGFCRLFTYPLAPLAGDDMPGQPWLWGCVVEKRERTLLIKAAQTAPPPGSLGTLISRARTLGFTKLLWERCEGSTLRLAEFHL